MGALTNAKDNTTTPTDPIKAFLEPIRKRAQVALAKGADKDRFYLAMYEAMVSTPKLSECKPQSVYGALVACAQLGLVPNGKPPQAYLIPYHDKRHGMMCRLELDYRGMMTLVQRDPSVASIYGGTVCEGDAFEMSFGDGGGLRHTPARRDRGDVEGFYAYLSYRDGRASRYVYMTKSEVEAHRDKYSQSGRNGGGPAQSKTRGWADSFEAMAQKTCIKRLCTRMALDLNAAEAIHTANKFDGQTITMEHGEIVSVDTESLRPHLQIEAPTEESEADHLREKISAMVTSLSSRGFDVGEIVAACAGLDPSQMSGLSLDELQAIADALFEMGSER